MKNVTSHASGDSPCASTILHLPDGSSIDLRQIVRVGRLGGDPDWLRYVVVLTGGTIIEFYETRQHVNFGPVPQIARADLVAKWEAATATLPRDVVRQLVLESGLPTDPGQSDLPEELYRLADLIRAAK